MSEEEASQEKRKSAPVSAAEEDAEELLLHRQTEARLKEIETEVRKQPLASELLPLSDLEAQYENEDANFLSGLRQLQREYGHMRLIRGDGNCYYRAFLYSLAEYIQNNPDSAETKRILQWIRKDSWEDVLRKGGYDEFAIEAFYDSMVGLLEEKVGAADATALHREMNEEGGVSDYCTWYCRVIAATYLKQDPDRFLPYIVEAGCNDMGEFCRREVEPMGKECEQVQALALAEAAGVSVKIAYLDGRQQASGIITHHTFGPDNAVVKMTLLYRPGHYDILYPRQTLPSS